MSVLNVLIVDTGLDIWWFIILCGVSFLASFIAASLGLGGGILLLATIALVLPPVVLIPLHGVVQIGSNMGRAILMRRYILFSIVPAFAVGSIIGVVIGTHFLISLPTGFLQFILALFILYATWAPKFQAHRPGLRAFFGVGIISSIVTMFVGATGPLIAPFVSAAGKDRQQVVATHGTLMMLQHSLKVISFGMIGFAFGPYIPLLVCMISFGFAGTYTGQIVLHRLPEKVFRTGLKIILTLLAVRLFYTAVIR